MSVGSHYLSPGHRQPPQSLHPTHDDVIKWKPFPRYWPFVQGIHRSTVTSPHKGQWREALMFSFICASTNDCANNRDTGDLRHHCTHYDITAMNYLLYSCIKVWPFHPANLYTLVIQVGLSHFIAFCSLISSWNMVQFNWILLAAVTMVENRPGPCFNIKTVIPKIEAPIKMISGLVRPSYLYNWISYTGKMVFL